jgi:hypothetical protein
MMERLIISFLLHAEVQIVLEKELMQRVFAVDVDDLTSLHPQKGLSVADSCRSNAHSDAPMANGVKVIALPSPLGSTCVEDGSYDS